MTNPHANAIEAAARALDHAYDAFHGSDMPNIADLAQAAVTAYLAAMEAADAGEVLGRAMDACLETGCIRADKMAEWLSANGFVIAARPRVEGV